MEALFFPPICSRSPKEASCRRHALPFTDAAPAAPRPKRSARFPYAPTLRCLPTALSDPLFPSALFFTVCVFQSALSRPVLTAQDVSLLPRRCGAFRPHLLVPCFRPPCFLQSAFFKAPCHAPPRALSAFPLCPDIAAPAACSFSVLLFTPDRYQKRPPQRRRPACSKIFFCVDSAFRRADAPRLICVETARPPSSPPCETGSGFFSWPARRPAPKHGIPCFPAKSAPPPGSTDGQRHTASFSSGSGR